jgi:hypothetical protein
MDPFRKWIRDEIKKHSRYALRPQKNWIASCRAFGSQSQ